jgi:hypothetical protein
MELELNLYTGSGQNVGYTVLTNGLTGVGGGNGNYRAPGNVQINGGNPINITMYYANQRMALTFTDILAHASFTTNLIVGDLTQIVGANTAFVGFTGADGGSTSIQTISNFSFTSIPPTTIQVNGTNVLIYWPDGAPGYTLQQKADLTTSNWTNVTSENIFTNGLNRVVVPRGSSNAFYRLILL